MSNGPIPFTCTTVSSVVSAAWCIFPGKKWNPPAVSVVAGASIVSPMCRTNAPETIVSCSSLLCQCGGILYPAGTLRRSTNAALFVGSPCNTAIWAPFGRSGGASPHLMSPVLTDIAAPLAAGAAFLAVAVAVSAARAGVTASSKNGIVVAKIFMGGSLSGWPRKLITRTGGGAPVGCRDRFQESADARGGDGSDDLGYGFAVHERNKRRYRPDVAVFRRVGLLVDVDLDEAPAVGVARQLRFDRLDQQPVGRGPDRPEQHKDHA